MSKAYKRKRRIQSLGSMLYMIFISLLILPLALLVSKLWRKKAIDTEKFFGMGVNLDKFPDITPDLVNELGINKLLVRFKMDEFTNIQAYKTWLDSFSNANITMNIIQDPNLNNNESLHILNEIFTAFSPKVSEYQIGSTINRSKWGFYSVNEYLRFFRQAQKLRKDFPQIKLLGPSVIDFEYHYTTQALFNFYPIHFDACSALLYVDRTVTPENKQFGFNLLGKINLLYSLLKLSPKSSSRLIITETNWPLKGSGDYAPTSDLECVTPQDAANYLVRYYLLALASGKVETVYWHQLIAVGFGLINPLKNLEKRPAFYAFKTLVNELKYAKDIRYKEYANYYELAYTNKEHEAKVLWTNNKIISYKEDRAFNYLTQDAKKQSSREVQLTASPIYIITKKLL